MEFSLTSPHSSALNDYKCSMVAGQVVRLALDEDSAGIGDITTLSTCVPACCSVASRH